MLVWGGPWTSQQGLKIDEKSVVLLAWEPETGVLILYWSHDKLSKVQWIKIMQIYALNKWFSFVDEDTESIFGKLGIF